MDFVTTLFQSLQDIVTSIGGLIGNVFESVVSLVYTAGEAGEGGQLTIVGYLLIISAAVGLFFFALSWIKSLIKLKA